MLSCEAQSLEEKISMKVDALAGVRVPTLDVEPHKVSYVVLRPFENVAIETQKVDNVLQSFEEKEVLDSVAPFVLETQKV